MAGAGLQGPPWRRVLGGAQPPTGSRPDTAVLAFAPVLSGSSCWYQCPVPSVFVELPKLRSD